MQKERNAIKVIADRASLQESVSCCTPFGLGQILWWSAWWPWYKRLMKRGQLEPSNPLGFRCWIFYTEAWVVWNGFGFRQGGKKLEGLDTWKILEFSSSRTVTRSYSSTPLSEEMVMGLDDGIAEEKDIMLRCFFFLWKDQGLCFRDGDGCLDRQMWYEKRATQRHTWASAKSWIQEE